MGMMCIAVARHHKFIVCFVNGTRTPKTIEDFEKSIIELFIRELDISFGCKLKF